jgi:Ca-activated chloride channel family protein
MFSRVFPISRTLRAAPPAMFAPLAMLALFLAAGSSSMAQTEPAPATQVQPTQAQAQSAPSITAPAMHDPTRPETQQRLDIDRDPILSPDIEEAAPSGTTSTTTPAHPGELQKAKDGVYTMHTDVDEVLNTCAVVDEKGRTVEDLKQGDFHVWEDGVAQSTTSFLHQDQPVALGIMVDNSGSMRDKREAVNAAALTLLRASNPKDSTFIVNFSEHAFLDQGFTSDINLLNRGLSHYDAKGTTALYDAVAASADELSNHGKMPRQVLLIITDGADNASRLDLVQAIRRVQNLGGPVVYTIGLLFDADKEEAARAKSDLESLSRETGGIAYFPASLRDVDNIATEVARDIRDQYTIGYHSTKAANLGGFRTVRIEASAPKHGKMIVRTRRGYYASKSTAQPPTQTAEAAKP